VRIMQKSQENSQNQTNTNTGIEEHIKSRENAIKDESTRWQGKMSPSTLIGGDPRKNDTMDMKEAQGNKAYTLEVHTKEAQRLLTHGCHAGNPCALHSNLTAKSTPIIERMYGQDWKERAET
ncbi:hypothetical protein Tco_1416943, partial [Tanacetum coccineum]